MITDAVETTIATGEFPSCMEAEEFLDVLNDAGYSKHLAKPAGTSYADGKHIVTLHIKEYAQFVMMASLDEEGPLEKWGNYFSFNKPLK